MSIVFKDGRVATAAGRHRVFTPTSALASSTHHPHSRQLHLQTLRGHNVIVELPLPDDLSPVDGRPTVYLDQNHWSTLAKTLHSPERVRDERERTAARKLITLATDRQVLLPMSFGHVAETCKQVDSNDRYLLALTILRLSAGWQLREPLSLRGFELTQALTSRFRGRCLLPPAAITLEPNAIKGEQEGRPDEINSQLPPEARWTIHTVSSISGIVDTMLDDEHVEINPVAAWVASHQGFADFLHNNPSEKELKRRRTHAKFMADTRGEIATAAARSGITPENLSTWLLEHSEEDVSRMPALGAFREVLHEKLVSTGLGWEENDLIDMMYLTAAAGYCDHVVGERSHASHLTNGLRRLGRVGHVYRSLHSLMEEL
jgi:hypothetical protein